MHCTNPLDPHWQLPAILDVSRSRHRRAPSTAEEDQPSGVQDNTCRCGIRCCCRGVVSFRGAHACVCDVLLPAQLHPHAHGSSTGAVHRPWPAALHCHTTLASTPLLPALASRCVGSPSVPSIRAPAGHRAIAVSVESIRGHPLPARSHAGALPRHLSAVPPQLPLATDVPAAAAPRCPLPHARVNL